MVGVVWETEMQQRANPTEAGPAGSTCSPEDSVCWPWFQVLAPHTRKASRRGQAVTEQVDVWCGSMCGKRETNLGEA